MYLPIVFESISNTSEKQVICNIVIYDTYKLAFY